MFKLLFFSLLLPSLSFAYSNSLDIPDFHMEFRTCPESPQSTEFSVKRFKCNRAGEKVVLCNVYGEKKDEVIYFVNQNKTDAGSSLEFGTEDGQDWFIINNLRSTLISKKDSKEVVCKGSYFTPDKLSKALVIDVSTGINKAGEILGGSHE